jgi:diguanylate cyclase (GGDEF)-like protein/PAS domain S-box-containing protein
MKNDPPADIHAYLKTLERVPEVFQRSWDAIAIYDLEGRILLGNAAARALVGGERAVPAQRYHLTSCMTLEASTQAARDFARCIALGRTVNSRSVFVDGTGQTIPVRLRLVPARLNGKIVGVIGFARDQRLRRDVEQQFMRSEQQFRSLFENHPDALTLQDMEGRFLRVNAACERLTGYSVEELIGQTPALFTAPGRYDPARIREVVERGETVEFEAPIITKRGGVREIDGRRVPLQIDGTIRGYWAMLRDVTEERRAARHSARQAARIAELYRIASSAGVSPAQRIATALEAGVTELAAEWGFVARTDDGVATIVQSAAANHAEMPEQAVLLAGTERLRQGLEEDDVFVSHEPPVFALSFAGAALAAEGRRYGTVAFARAGDAMELSPIDRDYVRALAGLIGSAIQQGEREKRLDTLAFGDALTGLPNRTLLQDRLEQTLLSARRHRRSFAAHYVDIDHFKTINDTYGHQVGDAVLVAVSAWLRSVLRDSDTIGRMGGDEFVVLQPEIDSQRQAEELAAKLCAIRDQTFRIGPHDIAVTISVGCAVFPVDGENPVDMLKAADAALYDVKHRGRDGYAVGIVT